MFDNEFSVELLLCLLAIISITALIYVIYRIFRNPFEYPYFTHTFDITSKRNVNIEDYIDSFLCNKSNWFRMQSHEQHIRKWKNDSERYIKSCKLRKYRAKQYRDVLDDKGAYHFKMIRKQTRYRQRNYVKTAYKVSVIDSEWSVSWRWLVNRYERLGEIGFEATLREYNSKNQRKLMTPVLRKEIMIRDNFTCQECGKYMPDEVGLHIDHIMPVSRGGKSVPSNLRVLCSKCNGSKGAK